jgi:hypothetical protein
MDGNRCHRLHGAQRNDLHQLGYLAGNRRWY